MIYGDTSELWNRRETDDTKIARGKSLFGMNLKNMISIFIKAMINNNNKSKTLV
jgi:hypothetical protein